jgi:hypothetical protein
MDKFYLTKTTSIPEVSIDKCPEKPGIMIGSMVCQLCENLMGKGIYSTKTSPELCEYVICPKIQHLIKKIKWITKEFQEKTYMLTW